MWVLDASRRVIVIDALDECATEGEGGSCHSARDRIAREEEHQKVLEVLSTASRSPHFPFCILLGSRPERAIRQFFSKFPPQELYQITLGTEDCSSDADIALLLRCRLKTISQFFDIEKHTPGWPSEDLIQMLVRKASGQFIYIATVLRFIEEAESCSPQERLQLVLGLPSPTTD